MQYAQALKGLCLKRRLLSRKKGLSIYTRSILGEAYWKRIGGTYDAYVRVYLRTLQAAVRYALIHAEGSLAFPRMTWRRPAMCK